MRDRLASLRPVSVASSRIEAGLWRLMASSIARLAGDSNLTIASAETCSACAAIASLSNHFFGTPRAASGSQMMRFVHAANSPSEPTL
ncbi:MAG: hypothetical protein WA184_24790 [Stellaceae bacterium]